MQIQSVFRASRAELPLQTLRGEPGSLLGSCTSRLCLQHPMAGPCLVQEVMDMEVKPQPSQPHWYERHIQPCLAELLGTALFIFIGCLAVLEDSGGTGRLQPALAHGLALGVTVTVLGNIR